MGIRKYGGENQLEWSVGGDSVKVRQCREGDRVEWNVE
tara:strand:+ start:204 stop:317 length:114 start_codon:yes stop_codon:yes gene_type:complete